MADRPPAPPRRRCQRPGCEASPLYPGKDWSVFCGMHSGALNERLAAWVARFSERQPKDAEDYGYNHAINDVVRELQHPTPGSEAPPLPTLDADTLARAEHFWCVEVEGEFALAHEWTAHKQQAAYLVARLTGDVAPSGVGSDD